MDKILRELNLGTLVDRFDAEKIEPDNVISASESELTRLSVSTIGDRIRLRDLCNRADLEVPSVSTSRNREERLALFNPRKSHKVAHLLNSGRFQSLKSMIDDNRLQSMAINRLILVIDEQSIA